MRRTVALLCLLARASWEMQAVQRYFIARRARTDSAPVQAGYAYRQINNGPATVETLHSVYADTNEQGNAVKLPEKSTEPSKDIKSNKRSKEGLPTTTSENSVVFRAAENNIWPERDASGKLKFAATSMVKSYDSIFRPDDEDVRTDFKNFDIWPFFYQNLYEYEPMKFDVDDEKAKEKRFAIPTHKKVIPVHENVDETAGNEGSESKTDSRQDYKHINTATTDNPIFGNQPFFSYVLNDYFDKPDEDEPTSYKGLSWEKEFDDEMALQDSNDNTKRTRRLEENTPKVNREENERKSNAIMEHNATHESMRSKGRNSQRESDSSEKGDDNKHSYDGEYRYDGENYRGFKDFADSFAHRFGLEDHDRNSNYAKKNNADKGEKKKGFRKVYHKDEYQEDHDFFDNTDNSENVEERGASKVRIGGSEAFLRSLAGAATGSDDSKLRNAENLERKQFERNHKGKQQHNEIERELDQYRDVAKHAALGNNAEYVDRYRL